MRGDESVFITEQTAGDDRLGDSHALPSCAGDESGHEAVEPHAIIKGTFLTDKA